MYTFIQLPADWLTQLTGAASSIASNVMPFVLTICGIFLAITAIRFIVGLVKK